ncbi:MAG: hypothetical protein U9Q22_03080 [Candidatus Altiarchaeota archaeon]|nr:hypothetical protein [Candidatus Altiarchaeota archaeon]
MQLRSLRGKKAQTSVEYLLTYGWTVIIIGVALVALWQMDVFKTPAPPPGCTGFEQVTPIDCKADNSGMIELVLTNEAGARIKLNTVSAEVFGKACTLDYNPGTKPELRAGQTIKLNVSGCTFNGVGEYYKADITIAYHNVVSEMDHNSVGECHGAVEA